MDNNWVRVQVENYLDNVKDYDIIYLNVNQISYINIDTNEITIGNKVLKLCSTNDLVKITKEINKTYLTKPI